jgi:HPt (histidine-containing phosphotransfer) domain-containing protein
METGMAEPEDLKRYFAGRLPVRLTEIEDSYHAARDAGWTGEPLRTFHRLVHSLAGAGATFGFPEVGNFARRLEHRLAALLRNGGAPPNDPEIREIENLLAELLESSTAG